jgi:adenylate cyclase
MSRLPKAVILGIITAISGSIFCFIAFGHELEEDIALDMLFMVRGQRNPPPDVVIISIDKLSAETLNLPNNPEKWPHGHHAQLVENLTEEGARVIAFDIYFGEKRSEKDERLFAGAISRARNVVLVSSIKTDKIIMEDERGMLAGDMNVERLVSPIPSLTKSSIAVAPFPLPKVPIKVSQYWTFKPSAGDIPTLPVAMFQSYALDVYDDFIRLLKTFVPSVTDRLPADRDELLMTANLASIMRIIRDTFTSNPDLAEKMESELHKSNELAGNERKKDLIMSLIKMYSSSGSSYLNFYGYPQTITTIPYYEVLQIHKKPALKKKYAGLNGKAIFVGSSETYQPEQRDGHYTVFSRKGLDISGVEIAATAFANILEDIPVQPLSLRTHLLIILTWGIIIGVLCRMLSNLMALLSVMGMGVAYFTVALYQFKTSALWYPIIAPLFFQTPLAFFGAVVWKYIDANRERQNIKKAFSFYLPDEVVEKISKNISGVETTSQVVYGTCLSTDAERYTTLSETMEPGELSIFMNKYYEAVFKPVKQHGGIVSNVIADAMLAIWVTVQPDATSRKQACLAALDIRSAVYDQSSSSDVHLPTRIGLHSGHISLGNIGAIDHFEYRPVGDIVNTATRIDGLNKYLGTRILLSGEVLDRIDGLRTRRLGRFLLAGKSKPLEIHELLYSEEDTSLQKNDMCELFSKALDLFYKRSWPEASGKFQELTSRFGNDGPSLFYLKMCEHYRENQPGESWDGVISLDKK